MNFKNFENFQSKSLLIKYLKDIWIFLNLFSPYISEISDEEQIWKLQTIEGLMGYAMYPGNSFKK